MRIGSSLLRLPWLLALVAMQATVVPRARASTNLFKFYVGGSVGHADLRANDDGLISRFTGSGGSSLHGSDSAWQLTAGLRALEVLGAEVDYFDLGSSEGSASRSGVYALTGAHISQKGEAAFALLYLPIPFIDVYFKAGVAHLSTGLSATVTGPLCVVGVPCAVFLANEAIATAFADGAGVQLKLGDWAIRGEYERFTALGEHASLASVGVTWSFF